MSSYALPRTSPESQGVPSAAVLALVDRLDREGLEPHSIMVLRHGQVIAEGWWAPYHRDGITLLYSLSKSFTSTAVGLAVAEGRFALDDPLATFFPDAAEVAGPRARELTVHDALSMSTGHRVDTLEAMGRTRSDRERAFFATEPEEPTGTWFVYNNGATFMAGAVVQKTTGERLVDYLRPRLFDPLGIERAEWLTIDDGRDQAFSGLHLATESIARFGQLLLDGGRWRDERILPEGWVERATSALTDNSMNDASTDWQRGYGYQFWRAQHGYRGDGAYGQYCIVLPDEDAVVVITSAHQDMQASLTAVWEELVPAFAAGPIAEDGAAVDALTSRLAAAEIVAPVKAAAPMGAGPWIFRREPGGEHPALSEVTVEPVDRGWRLSITDGDTITAECGSDHWPEVSGPYVARGGWTAPGLFEARVVAVETPHHLLLRGTVSGDEADGRLDARWNVLPLGLPALSALHAPSHNAFQ